MPKKFLVIASALVVATIASAVALAFVLPGVRLLPRYWIDALDILPGEETLLVLQEPSIATIEWWAETFPVLRSAAQEPLPRTLAVVETAEGERGWIRIDMRDGTEHTIERQIVGPFLVMFSSDRMRELFESSSAHLDQLPTIQALAPFPRTPWTLLRRDTAPAASSLAGRIVEAAALGTASHLLAMTDEDGYPLLRTGVPAEDIPLRGLQELHSPLGKPFTMLKLADSASFLERVRQALSPHDRIVFDGLLLQWIVDHFGPSVSVVYDILPLLEENPAVHLASRGSGTTVFVLEGEAKNSKEAERILASLHTSFAHRHADVEIVTRVFDENFHSTIIRKADERPGTTEEVDGWRLRTSEDTNDGAVLVSAQNGKVMIIGNARDAVEGIFKKTKGMYVSAVHPNLLSTDVVAAGIIPDSLFQDSALLSFFFDLPGQKLMVLDKQNRNLVLRELWPFTGEQ